MAKILEGSKIRDNENDFISLCKTHSDEGLNYTRNYGDFLNIWSEESSDECNVLEGFRWQGDELETKGKETIMMFWDWEMN